MVLNISNLKTKTPVYLAPMAGITDTPSRSIFQKFNPSLVVSEMIASSPSDKQYFINTVKSNLYKLSKQDVVCPTSVQIAGFEIDWMAEAAKIVESEGGTIIDINMGCPAKKIVGRQAGSGLMKYSDHALRIIDAVVKSTNLPVTLKMRLGWDENNLNAGFIAKRAEESGIKMLFIHARTRNQFFKGKADWAAIKPIKRIISIPVIINGDIVDLNSAMLALGDSNADGLMIGRGAIGRPWLISQLSSGIYGQQRSHGIPTNRQLAELVCLHLNRTLRFYGTKSGILIFRKHLAAYLKNLEIKKEEKLEILRETTPKKLILLIRLCFTNNPMRMI